MKRKIKDFLSVNALAHLRYLPGIALKVRNWPSFLFHYLGFVDGEATFFFRDGLQLKTVGYFDVLTAAVVLLKKDYGQISGGTVIDIGANIGAFSLYAASAGAIVYAFEPMPDNFELFLDNINSNDLQDKIKPMCQGVAGRAGRYSLYLSGSPFHTLYADGDGSGRDSVEIDCVTLEDIFIENNLDRIDILKVDCEGAEFDIFYSLPEEYFSRIGEIRMEYHDQADAGHNIAALQTKLAEEGFETVYYRADTASTGNIRFRATNGTDRTGS